MMKRVELECLYGECCGIRKGKLKTRNRSNAAKWISFVTSFGPFASRPALEVDSASVASFLLVPSSLTA